MLRVITLFKLLPIAHRIILSSLFLVSVVIVLLPSENAQASKQTVENQYSANTRYTVPLAFRKPEPPKFEQNNQKQLVETEINAINSSDNSASTHKSHSLNTDKFKVQSGDTLAKLFHRIGLTSRDVYEISQLSLAKKNLLKLMPGEQIEIAKNSNGEFVHLNYIIDPITTLKISKLNDTYNEQLVTKQVESRSQFASASIDSNFWNAAVDAGLTPNQIMQIATLFGWDIDFALDLRKGDSFSLIYEQEYADGEFLKNGNILAAEFINQNERFTAIRYSNGEYYSEIGRSMKKAFLRLPVDFTRISSSFNPRRIHPVTGGVKAHRGVDYVAPRGTPIKSTGRGRVIKSGYSKYNGNYVFIKHNDTYTTKYLHLQKRKVKTGQTVKQGQIIGTLGSTGRVTGAHLHYEFIVNGVHRNPRTVKLPKSTSIAKKEKANFLTVSKQMIAQLEHQKQLRLAGNITE
ncbi:peptidase M23 [Parashewanella spongiae]|uniref:Peptidase M23 n=1 Tax=Parashewanella spongiae TaxID=342950 RepID=A0A3A6TQT2_9GAMM|nr:peptidoglycan DD-metalloendopeptidase family protein [Parashewanella spongiae]MCL1079645.1 peptidoglycan DD-metalloendopeptidase family protein [Parashewanella spongiae]RJY07227.1 peptidase M23 [Parashewanella spongiae]